VIEGQVAWTASSDRRWKESISETPLGLDFILGLRPVEYIRKNDEKDRKELGFIAQEVKALLAEVKYSNAGLVQDDESKDHFLGIRYQDFFAPIVKAIQEINAKGERQAIEIRELRASNKALQASNAAMERRLEALERARQVR
jgi:trimeric autotransporter adhesin